MNCEGQEAGVWATWVDLEPTNIVAEAGERRRADVSR